MESKVCLNTVVFMSQFISHIQRYRNHESVLKTTSEIYLRLMYLFVPKGEGNWCRFHVFGRNVLKAGLLGALIPASVNYKRLRITLSNYLSSEAELRLIYMEFQLSGKVPMSVSETSLHNCDTSTKLEANFLFMPRI